jgi:DNA (cytosine-5)-methyltransferase 1
MRRAPELRLWDNRKLIVDLFAGGGGASVGIEAALGRSPDVAINHDPEAISIHRVNHPGTEHYIENVWKANPRKVCKGRKVGLMWLSPDCKHFSKAKGAKPVEKKIRSLAWVAVYWAKAVKPEVICLENVEEFQKWGPLIPKLDDEGRPMYDAKGKPLMVPCPARMGVTFRLFVKRLQNLGYKVEYRELVAADYGAPTTRKRLFLIARSDGLPIVWPVKTHDQHGRNGLAKWLPAADCIDWALPCPSIFERKKALAANTQRRIARGIEKFVKKDPFIVPVVHAGDARVHSLGEPMRTITGAHRGELALAHPYLVRTAHGERDAGGKKRGKGEHQLDLPLPTLTASNDFALTAPLLARIGQTGGHGDYVNEVTKPLTTVTSKAEHLLVSGFLKPRYGERPGQDPRCIDIQTPMRTVVPTGNGGDLVATFLAKHNAGHEATGQKLEAPVDAITARDSKALVQVQCSSIVKLRGTCAHGQPVTRPLDTVSAQGNHFAEVRAFLMKYHRDGGQLAGLKDPMPTIPCNDNLALVTVEGEEYAIVDIGMRMLQPPELFRAHAFPRGYVIDRGAEGEAMTKEAQVRMVGNSVPPPMAEAIVRAQFGLVAQVAEAVA